MSVMEKIRGMFTPRDMTEGTPWKRIAEFAFPMLVGNFAQQLYNTVDAVVVGRSKGYEALAAVGNAGPILNLLLALFVGISTGAGILVSQYYGAKNREKLERTIGSFITVTAIASVFVMIVGPMITGPLLVLVGTLPEMFDACKAYLDIFFYGIAGVFFYNVFAGILRGLGDSFSALMFLFACAFLNVIGDLLLVEKMGVAGVALATAISQAISAVLCLIKLMGMKDVFTLSCDTLKPRKEYIVSVVRLGIPSGITQAIMSCSGMIVQSLINSFNDAMFVACNVMIMRVDGYAMLPNFSFGQALGTYAGQNVGAGKIDRVKQGAKQGIIMALATALVLVPVIVLCGPWLMELFTPDSPELVKKAMSMLYMLAPGYIAVGVTQCLQGVMRGAGDTMTPMWISFGTTILLRIPLAYAMVALAKSAGAEIFTQQSMVFTSMLICWFVGLAITALCYVKGGWKKKIANFTQAKSNPTEG